MQRKSLSNGSSFIVNGHDREQTATKRWVVDADYSVVGCGDVTRSWRSISAVPAHRTGLQATDNEDDSVDFEEMLRDVSGDGRGSQSDAPEDSSPTPGHDAVIAKVRSQAVTHMGSRHDSVSGTRGEAESFSNDERVKLECGDGGCVTDETISSHQGVSNKWNRTEEIHNSVVSPSAVASTTNVYPVETLGEYKYNYEENNGVLNLRVKPEPAPMVLGKTRCIGRIRVKPEPHPTLVVHAENGRLEIRESPPSDTVLDYRSGVGHKHKGVNGVEIDTAAEEGSDDEDSLIASLEERLKRTNHELTGQRNCNSALRAELSAVQDINLALQEDLSNRDFHIVHLAEDFFKLHDQFRVLARQFQQVLGGAESSTKQTQVNGSYRNGHSQSTSNKTIQPCRMVSL